jgi:hypothetical protein
MQNIKATLYDAHGNEVETFVAPPEVAAVRAAVFVLHHGGDPEEDGAGAQPGRIRFEPTDEPADEHVGHEQYRLEYVGGLGADEPGR